MSQWADQYRVLGSETSAEPGRWNTDRAPYQRDIMDAINDPEVEKVVLKSSAQVGKTEILLNILGWIIDVEPGPVLLVQPTVEIAEDFSKRRFASMLRLCDTLREKVAGAKSRESSNTILMKSYPGGSTAMTGANSPVGLASRPCRFVLCDEVDRFPPSAGTEGDPLKLAEKRAITWWNRKYFYDSTPTIKGQSRIDVEYELGTQEEWQFECPSCGQTHAVRLGDLRYDVADKTSASLKDPGIKSPEIKSTGIGDRQEEISNLRWSCPDCGLRMTEREVKRAPARWVALNPGAKRVRSFWLNAFMSLWSDWNRLVAEFLECEHDPERLKTYVNTILGESYEDTFGEMSPENLMARREAYDAELPVGPVVLTCGLDTQNDRLEYEVVGWGPGEESWGIVRGMILGAPDDPRVWTQVDDLLERTFRRSDGRGLRIACAFVDSGGHYTQDVYRECRKREARRLYAIKGQGGEGVPYVKAPKREQGYGAMLLMLGVDAGKQLISSALQISVKGPRYCHFPENERMGYDRAAFDGMLSERLVRKRVGGRDKWAWEKSKKTGRGKDAWAWEKIRSHARNESFDCRNYALAALHALNPNYEALAKRLEKSAEDVGTTQKETKRQRAGVVSSGIQV